MQRDDDKSFPVGTIGVMPGLRVSIDVILFPKIHATAPNILRVGKNCISPLLSHKRGFLPTLQYK